MQNLPYQRTRVGQLALSQCFCLRSKGTVDVWYGSQPVFMANLLVRVSNAGINDAQTPEDVLSHIDQLIPFIESPT